MEYSCFNLSALDFDIRTSILVFIVSLLSFLVAYNMWFCFHLTSHGLNVVIYQCRILPLVPFRESHITRAVSVLSQ